MMIHLESGTCDSGVDCVDLDRFAYLCYQSRAYTNGWSEHKKYKCPECQKKLRLLSGLFQHVESDACNQQIRTKSIGKLVHFISTRV